MPPDNEPTNFAPAYTSEGDPYWIPAEDDTVLPVSVPDVRSRFSASQPESDPGVLSRFAASQGFDKPDWSATNLPSAGALLAAPRSFSEAASPTVSAPDVLARFNASQPTLATDPGAPWAWSEHTREQPGMPQPVSDPDVLSR